MRTGDTYGPRVTHGDTTISRCVIPQVPAQSGLARRVTQMTLIRLSTHHVRVRMRTRLRKSCFSVTSASCVTSRHRRATLAHVAAGRVAATTVPTRGPARLTPTWAATARVGAMWVTGASAAANRYSGGSLGPRRRREQPQTPTDLLPVDRRAARGPRRSPTLATGRAVAPSARTDRPSPHGPTWGAWAAVAADRRRPVHPAPAWRHVP